jgi:hypothetical protein
MPATTNLAIINPTNNFDSSMERIIASTNNLYLNNMDSQCTSPTQSQLLIANTPQKHEEDLDRWVRGAVFDAQEHVTEDSYIVDRSITPSAFAAITEAPRTNMWIGDTGASRHIVNNSTLFTDLASCKEAIGGCKNDSVLGIVGKGTIEIVITSPDDKPTILVLHDVRYAPDARCNLLSIPTITFAGKGYQFLINEYDMNVIRKDTMQTILVAKLHLSANVYVFQAGRPPTTTAAAAVDFDDPV